MNRVFFGDCRETMRDLKAQGVRVQCCVTSPPYWGLRDYGVAGQIGLEPTLDEWVAALVEVFRGVRNLLSDDGTLWLNLGDSYATGTAGDSTTTQTGKHGYWENPAVNKRIDGRAIGLKPKDLIGQPWALAFALRADGWYLRQDIIWSKPNPMPESVTDRCTKAHEYLFLLSKSGRYYYDFAAMQEPAGGGAHARRAKTPDGWDTRTGQGGHGSFHAEGREKGRVLAQGVGRRGSPPGNPAERNTSMDEALAVMPNTRNRRSVWTVASEPYSEAHFATFPTALIEPCILAGSRPGDLVLDPFMGSGTTAQVAQALGRQWIGCELNTEYAPLQAQRTAQSALAL